ncbi:ImuA family protein [Kumtagia ephedrae]|uniref:ImuA family protein n=1 Tax=Kumtagia ephedrae TaxID=2116701 RepID=UPI001FDEF6B8|nr:hypothetical protein [Mesorhizobium ephedrae]
MAAHAVAQDLVRTLRHQIAKIEGRLAERLDERQEAASQELDATGGKDMLPIGVQRLDAALGGGLPASGLAEIHGHASRDAGAAAGFALALVRLLAQEKGVRPLLWVGTADIFREAGRPYAPGLTARFGLSPENLLVAEAEKLTDVLWIAEEAARLDAFQAVLLEIRGNPPVLDLTATRRLHRRALLAGLPLFLVRAAGEPEPTAAPLRLTVAAAPAAPRLTLAGPLAGSIGPPAFRVTIGKSRTAIHAAFTLEWIDDAFRERRKHSATDTVPVVPLPPRGPAVAAAAGKGLAGAGARRDAAAGVQPAGEQYAAHRRLRRTG